MAEAARDDAIRAALFAHDGMEWLIREKGMPREAVEPEPVGFLAALEGLGFTVAALDATPGPEHRPNDMTNPVDAAWEALVTDLHLDDSDYDETVDRHRPLIEAAVRASSPQDDPA